MSALSGVDIKAGELKGWDDPAVGAHRECTAAPALLWLRLANASLGQQRERETLKGIFMPSSHWKRQKSHSIAAISSRALLSETAALYTLQSCWELSWDTKSNQAVVEHSLLCKFLFLPPKFLLDCTSLSLLNAQSRSSCRARRQLSILPMLSCMDAQLFFSFHFDPPLTEKPSLSSQAKKNRYGTSHTNSVKNISHKC